MNNYAITPKVKQLTHSKRRSFYLMTSTKYYVTLGWSGGSRCYYSLLDFTTGKELEIKGAGDNFSKQTETQDMPVNSILIETGMFNGKPSLPRIMCRPEQEDEVKKYLGIC